jgi:predicted N-acetyltransferase YhbS
MIDMKQWKVRIYQEGDETGIIDLMNLVFRQTKYDMEYTRERAMKFWSWKYKTAPRGFLTVVADDHGKIVGHMGLQLMDIKVGNKITTGSQACDLCVHPDYQRQGMSLAIGRALMKKAKDEKVFLTYGFPADRGPSYYGFMQYGWFDVSAIPVLVSYFDTHRAVEGDFERLKRMEPILRKTSKFLDWFFAIWRQHAVTSIENIEMTQVSCFDRGIDRIWNEVSKDYGIILVRDHRYLNWRYFARPDTKYCVIIAKKDGEIQGYAVLSKNRSARRDIGYIVDILSVSKDVFFGIVQASSAYLSRQSVDSVRCWMQPNQSGYRALKKSGFTPYLSQKIMRLTARVNSNEFFQTYKEAGEWYVTPGDSDWV